MDLGPGFRDRRSGFVDESSWFGLRGLGTADYDSGFVERRPLFRSCGSELAVKWMANGADRSRGEADRWQPPRDRVQQTAYRPPAGGSERLTKEQRLTQSCQIPAVLHSLKAHQRVPTANH